MTEKELLDAIRASAEDVEIPEQLAPESMKKQWERRRQPRKYPWKQLAGMAAVLLVAVGLTAALRLGLDKGGVQIQESAQEGRETAKGAADQALQTEAAGSTDETADGGTAARKGPKRDAGDMFAVAQDYDQVYGLLEENRVYFKGYGTNGVDGVRLEAAVDDAGSEEIKTEYQEAAAAPNGGAAADMDTMRGHSRTNVQTAGVDESDIIKTDGEYVYAVCQESIVITDISGEAMTRAGEIRLEEPGARVMEMYVQGNVLNLILQQEDSKFERLRAEETEKGAASAAPSEDVFFMDSQSSTHLLTYDISDRKNPVLLGDVAQDGGYYTSRKIGTIVYLFTTEYDMSEIPQIDGRKVAYDCIYLPERGAQGLLVSSIDVKKPDQVQDHVMVLNDYVDIYVSTGAMYLYQSSWKEQGVTTQIAKFSLDRGTINAVDAVSVKGEIRDTFAINEGSKSLRVLTTDWSVDQQQNHLYVLDEKLKLVGSLQGLAQGEEVYAARFLGDMAYFVTYRNTDPLFAVDLSDPAAPKVLSELKITGFSEYLHFWGEDKLLGIGYETDPETGRRQGLKLTMFDISNPSELATLDCVVLKGLDYSPALYEYKSALADSGANLFGFVGETYGNSENQAAYYLYQWSEGAFRRLLKAELERDGDGGLYRGLYSGGRFYLAGPDGITSYDREREYEELESLSY